MPMTGNITYSTVSGIIYILGDREQKRDTLSLKDFVHSSRAAEITTISEELRGRNVLIAGKTRPEEDL
ncbi:hypothetical protein CO104_04230 [Candidatus Collierbacteria bacterium CG_4_9_14_3_um_filter_43_16]|uniref:Uncharacterized protein n=1 Tax=Candidatus Collierbacteria bacterium CG_4_9_14_3_um_filter_43_16 TaxID=1974532 RepID=A0A2M8BTL3_9BACT|nr:MAG: hypothetical protein CO104_04230 [Candidatus Collierbacteria bacterium CG_4_9_14_3_um_filter_43_16]